MRLKPELLSVLTDLESNIFTVAELTRFYLGHPKRLHQRQKLARQFIYRNLIRMEKEGLVEKLPNDAGWPKYRATQKFSALHTSKLSNKAPSETRPEVTSKPTSFSSSQSTQLNALRERLSQHRSDMLCAIGETEEYEALCKDIPGFNDKANNLYADARERSALLLGRIKALETLMSSLIDGTPT